MAERRRAKQEKSGLALNFYPWVFEIRTRRRGDDMTKQYAIDLAKRLYRDNDRSYFVIEDPKTEEFRVIEKAEKERDNLNRFVVFSIETDD